MVNGFADDQVIICSESNSWPLDIRHQQTICHDFKLQYDPSDLQQEEVEFIVKLVITILNDLVIIKPWSSGFLQRRTVIFQKHS